MKKIVIKILNLWYRIYGKIKFIGRNIYVGIGCKIINNGMIELNENVKLRGNAFISTNKNSIIKVGKNTDIGINSRICAANKIIIGDNVLFGPNVYIADQDHKYKDVKKPIMEQGAYKTKGIIIGEGTWIGINVVIIGEVTIGKNCVVGANSVLTKSIPDYSVAVGAPAKIIKKYDVDLDKWVKVQD